MSPGALKYAEIIHETKVPLFLPGDREQSCITCVVITLRTILDTEKPSYSQRAFWFELSVVALDVPAADSLGSRLKPNVSPCDVD
jgi:hypothetical protein